MAKSKQSNKKRKAIKHIFKTDIISSIAVATSLPQSSVKTMYEALEDIVTTVLEQASAKQDVSIRLLEGVIIDGNYIPEQEMTNNLTGERILVKSQIRPKARITKTYTRNINKNN